MEIESDGELRMHLVLATPVQLSNQLIVTSSGLFQSVARYAIIRSKIWNCFFLQIRYSFLYQEIEYLLSSSVY